MSADHRPEQTAIRTDLGAIFVSLELSRATWLITSLSPGRDKMSKHQVRGGDTAGLLGRLAELQAKAHARTGQRFPLIVIQEAGLDGFWIHRVLQSEGIESHVVDPASIATSRRRRRAKTDKIDGEGLLRALLAYKRGEPRVCAMVKAPTSREEDDRRISRERKVLTAERVAHVNRIKGLLFAQGISDYEPMHRDRRARTSQRATAGPCLSISKRRLAASSTASSSCWSSSKQWKLSAMRCSLQQKPRPSRGRQSCCSISRASDRSSLACFGRKGSTATSPTAGRWRPMPGWRRRPGRAAPLITNRVSRRPAIRASGRQ